MGDLAMRRLDRLKKQQQIVAEEDVLQQHKWKGLESEIDDLDHASIAQNSENQLNLPKNDSYQADWIS